MALLQVVRHSHGGNVVLKSNASFEEVPSVSGHAGVEISELMDTILRKRQLEV